MPDLSESDFSSNACQDKIELVVMRMLWQALEETLTRMLRRVSH